MGSLLNWFGPSRAKIWRKLSDQLDGRYTDFIVKGSDERLVRRFCRSSDLRRAMVAQKSIELAISDDAGWFGGKFPDDTDLLSVAVGGHLTDSDRIRDLFDLFAMALDQHGEIGAAYQDEPGHEL